MLPAVSPRLHPAPLAVFQVVSLPCSCKDEDVSALPLVTRSFTPTPRSNLAAADIGNISRITKTHKSLSITPKPLPDLKQSMAFEVSAFGVHGRGKRGAGGWRRRWRHKKKMVWEVSWKG